MYADGSAENAVKNGGEGVFIGFPDSSRATRSIATGHPSTNFRSEACLKLVPEFVPTTEKPCLPIPVSWLMKGDRYRVQDIRMEVHLLS